MLNQKRYYESIREMEELYGDLDKDNIPGYLDLVKAHSPLNDTLFNVDY